MGGHPINLAFRFILEIIALISVGTWGWKQNDGFLKFIIAIGLPLILGAIWGIFAVPDDPSRSGQTLVVTTGIIRLGIELGIFAIASWAIYNQGLHKNSYLFITFVIIHYLLSYDRIIWLLQN